MRAASPAATTPSQAPCAPRWSFAERPARGRSCTGMPTRSRQTGRQGAWSTHSPHEVVQRLTAVLAGRAPRTVYTWPPYSPGLRGRIASVVKDCDVVEFAERAERVVVLTRQGCHLCDEAIG